MKQVIRLAESDLHRLVNEAVREALNEIGYGEQIMPAYEKNPQYVQNYKNSLKSYWSEQGLSGDALDKKVQEILHKKAKRQSMEKKTNKDSYQKRSTSTIE